MFKVVKALNFLSFREGVEVSFELGKGQTSESEAAHALGVFGANSSGKTNLLRIFSSLKEICCNSAQSDPDKVELVKPFYNLDEEVSFYVEFTIADNLYRYEIDLTSTTILSEVIHRKRTGGNWTKIIEREGKELLSIHSDFEELNSLGSIRESASIISVAHYLGKDSIQALYDEFDLILCNIEGRGSKRILDYTDAADIYLNYPEAFSFVKEIIVKADMGISDIVIESYTTEDGENIYYPLFYHQINDSIRALLFKDESGGTQTLYSTLIEYVITLNMGGILVIDEIEINLHPLLYPLLLDLFLNPKKNKNNAQIIFTSHREDLFDILGKYRSIIVDKKENESCAYRLDNLPDGVIRNDRPITPLYLKGLLGGVPLLEKLTESSAPIFAEDHVHG